MLQRARKTFGGLPRKFWVLVLAMFVDRLGGTLIQPFFSLYITQKFNVGMTEAGLLFVIFSVTGTVGSMFGGALADRFGRKAIVIFSLVVSATSSVSMGLATRLSTFYALGVFVGLLSSVGGPAHQAMVADMLPKEKRAEGFGVLRVAENASWMAGPIIGGFLAARSYLLLFVLDAVCSIITAMIVLRFVPETKPEPAEAKEQGSLLQTFRDYSLVLKNRLYAGFLVASGIMVLVYIQLYGTLSVYMRDVHGIPPASYGMLMSLNAALVVVAQFWVSKKIGTRPPFLMMALGAAFYLVGFTMFGFVAGYLFFAVAMILVTIGEMIVVPVAQAIVARLAPPDMRGRYMAVFGLSWSIPSAMGTWAAGLIMDNFDPRWVWYAGGMLCTLSILGFILLQNRGAARLAAEEPDTGQHVALD